MAIHEVTAGLGFSTELAELGIPAVASLDFSADVAAGTLQTLELSAALALRTNIIGQGEDSAMSVTPMLEGELTRSEGKHVHTQPYKVLGVNHPTPEGRLFQAENAQGVPMDGTPHPIIPGIQVTNTRSRFQSESDQTRAIVDVTWSVPLATDLEKSGGASGTGLLSLSPSAFTETIFRDKDGNTMRIEYKATIGFLRRVVTSEQQFQTWTATLTKEFATPQYVDILRGVQVNNQQFGVFPARTLLFHGPTVNETDDAQYSHGYQLTYNPFTWKLTESIWVSGFVPEDATVNFNPPGEPGGLGVFLIYDEFDFNDLPVAFP